MKRIAILTAGGDTPALNATLFGAVERANQLRLEVFGLLQGFGSLYDPKLPHIHLNPLFCTIPELDPTHGGTILGASRDYLGGADAATLDGMCQRLSRLGIEGLVCVGGDGTFNGMQPLCDRLPAVLAPKTIDNDLGLNYPGEIDDWVRTPSADGTEFTYTRREACEAFSLEGMVNYVTPGYATAVFVAAGGVERVRTTAESHRRIAIIEAMGRQSGYLALGAAYGRPDLVLVPERPLDVQRLVERVKEIYDHQQNVVIVCGEGIVDAQGNELGTVSPTTDPAGNVRLSGAAEMLRELLIAKLGDDFFRAVRRIESAREAVFTRKVGHTQRGGRPLAFDRFYAGQLGGKAVDMLLDGRNNELAVLQWSEKRGFYVDGVPSRAFRDRWGLIHPRRMHPSFYDERRMQPSAVGIEYLLPIFTNAIGPDDVEHVRHTLFDSGNLTRRYHSINVDVARRVRRLGE